MGGGVDTMNWNQPDRGILTGLLLLMLENNRILSILLSSYLEFRCLNNCK